MTETQRLKEELLQTRGQLSELNKAAIAVVKSVREHDDMSLGTTEVLFDLVAMDNLASIVLPQGYEAVPVTQKHKTARSTNGQL